MPWVIVQNPRGRWVSEFRDRAPFLKKWWPTRKEAVATARRLNGGGH